jgi:sugar/nucleoside kinase (ribokinase family)
MSQSLPHAVSVLLRDAEKSLQNKHALVGLDGFVDTILHVVDKRQSASQFTRLSKMGDFARRIAAAAGQSANMEMVSQMVKLGGNGPIMANALRSQGPAITYIGNLGAPALHPVFQPLADSAKVISIAEPGYTDAVEFDDGKLMFGKHLSLGQVDWKNLTAHVPVEKLVQIFSRSSLIALVNWTMLVHMDGILKKLLTQVLPKLSGQKRWAFFDLADPAKRTRDDIEEVLRIIARFEKYCRVILGLNFHESLQIGDVLGIEAPKENGVAVARHAARIREKLKIDTVVIHPTAFAGAADATGVTHVDGPYVEKPKITTGAGDHFNAGFCIGRLLGFDLAASLQTGVGTSGYYVRNAKSPSSRDLARFLKTL